LAASPKTREDFRQLGAAGIVAAVIADTETAKRAFLITTVKTSSYQTAKRAFPITTVKTSTSLALEA
jgi:hypothetical protein